MKNLFCFTIFLSVCILSLHAISTPSISPTETEKIAHKIWHNECRGSIKGLTSWNEGEEFASLGIGHFIWHPQASHGSFKETFPELLVYLQDLGIEIEPWIKDSPGCPWGSKKEFDDHIDSPPMNQLRELLYKTRGSQALFIISRLEKCLPTFTKGLNPTEAARIESEFNRLLEIPAGIYALIDYLNFKGEGNSQAEQYRGKGWGLKDVLLGMDEKLPPLDAFVASAKETLTERVKNAPSERHEERWLKGWFNRLDTYKKYE